MTDIFIKQHHLTELKKIFKQIVPDAQVWAYGSRVDGTAHDGSDLDLAIVGFLVDVVKFDNLPESFKKEILKKYVIL